MPKVMMAMRWLGAKSTDGTWQNKVQQRQLRHKEGNKTVLTFTKGSFVLENNKISMGGGLRVI